MNKMEILYRIAYTLSGGDGVVPANLDNDMADVSNDQLVLIRIEGMHCHKCERAIQHALIAHDGVHEVEVDFASGQASVLFDRDRTSIKQLMDAVEAVGYRAVGFSQNNKADSAAL
jgi:copper chaperone CopZ